MESAASGVLRWSFGGRETKDGLLRNQTYVAIGEGIFD